MSRTKRKPKLESPIALGQWLCELKSGAQFLVSVIDADVPSGFAARWSHGGKILASPIRDDGRFGTKLGIQLLRPVRDRQRTGSQG